MARPLHSPKAQTGLRVGRRVEQIAKEEGGGQRRARCAPKSAKPNTHGERRCPVVRVAIDERDHASDGVSLLVNADESHPGRVATVLELEVLEELF